MHRSPEEREHVGKVKRIAATALASVIPIGAATAIIVRCTPPDCVSEAANLLERSPLPTPVPPTPSSGAAYNGGTVLSTTTSGTYVAMLGGASSSGPSASAFE